MSPVPQQRSSTRASETRQYVTEASRLRAHHQRSSPNERGDSAGRTSARSNRNPPHVLAGVPSWSRPRAARPFETSCSRPSRRHRYHALFFAAGRSATLCRAAPAVSARISLSIHSAPRASPRASHRERSRPHRPSSWEHKLSDPLRFFCRSQSIDELPAVALNGSQRPP